MSAKATTSKIAIIGSGPAGLTLARLLYQSGINVTVYEREDDPSMRTQGGTLDLHPQTGQLALKKAGLWAQFEKYARYEGQDFVITDHQGNRVVNIKDQDTDRPEIDRRDLRKILLESIPEDMIKWNHNLQGAEPGVLHFEHGSEVGLDLIVGADGAWSKVRPLVSDVAPFYSGISCMDFRIRDADKKIPLVSKTIGRGSYFAFKEDEYHSLNCQRNSDGSIHVYSFGRKRPDWENSYTRNLKDPASSREALLKEYAAWDPMFHALIKNCDDDIIPRTLYMLPPGLRWPFRSGVTLIGDAAHLMTPFAGEGVNAAMTDALVLADAIIQNPADLDKAVRVYQNEMFPRAQEVTERTWMSLHRKFDIGVLDWYKDRFAEFC